MSSPVGYPQRNAYPMFSSTSKGDTPVGVDGGLKYPLMVTTNSSGGNGNRRRGASVDVGSRRCFVGTDRLADLQNWLRPVHMPILQPQAHIGMTPITSGLLTISHDPTVGDFSGSSIKCTFSGATTATARIPIPAAAEQGVSSRPVRAGGAVHYRLMCSDWSKITRLYMSLTQDGGTSNYQLGIILNGGKSAFGMGDPIYSSRWNNRWRTLVMQSKDFSKVGAAADWGRVNRYYNCDGIFISAITTAAVDLWIDRIYSPDWPVAVVTPIFDGWYREGRDIAVNDFLPRGWGAGGSCNTVEMGDFYPGYADLRLMSELGFDVFAHGHQLSGATASPTNASMTDATLGQVLSAQRRAIFGAGVDPMSMRWHQWLGNVGNGAFDVAAHLRTHGINASRSDTIDGEWGINPHQTTYSSGLLIGDSSWASRRGRFNRAYVSAYNNISQGASYDSAPVDPAKPTVSGEIDYICKTGQKLTTYDHRVLAEPGQYDVSLEYHRGRMADWIAREKAGELLVLNPTDVERLTYWRPGDVFMRWDGEWVYRDDPTRIAF